MQKKYQKIISIILILITIFSFVTPNNIDAVKLTDSGYNTDMIQSHISDPDTSNNYQYLANGEVWTDKSVIDNSDGSMDIVLSAIANKNAVTIEETQGYDVVFILDTTGSMAETVNGISKYSTMINTLNNAINILMTNNDKNRISVVTYSTTTHNPLPLGRYTTTDQYFKYQTSTENGTSNPTIFVSENTTSTTNTTINYDSISIINSTYTQLGISRGKDVLMNTDSTDNIPVIILLTDGFPTNWSTDYENPTEETNVIPYWGSSSAGLMGYNTILTANYCKEQITTKYQKQAKFYTIGMLKERPYAKAILDPNAENIAALANDDGLAQRLKQHIDNTEETFIDVWAVAADPFNGHYQSTRSDQGVYDPINKTITYELDELVPIKYNSNNAVSKGTYFYFQATIDPDSTLAKSQYIKANISFETEDGTKYNETIDFAQSQSDNFLLGIHASNKTAIINGSTVNYTEYYFRAHTTTKFYNVKVILSLNPAVNTNFVTYTGYKNPFENLDYADQSYIGQLTESDLKVIFENIINELQYTESTLMPNTYMTFSDTIGEKFDINSNIKITLNKKDYNFTNNNGIYKCNASSILWSDETREITTDDIIISIKNKILEIKLPSEIIPIIGTNIIPIRIQYTLELNNIESGTYYTNDSAFATFTPYNSNEYYKKLSEKITAKTVNNTETETFVKKSSISNELATDFLGNNGKIVIAIEKLTITKIWDDENNKYETRPETLNITLLQNETVYKTYTLNSTNALETDENKWQITNIKVPKYDSNGNEYIYTIQEDENNFNLLYYYQNPIYNQDTLTVTNTAVWLEVKDDSIPEYRIAIVKEIINDSGSIANSDDFAKIKLDSTATYNFPIVLKQLNTVLSKGETSMLEDYEGYSGNIYNGIVTNKGNLVFNNIPAGKYEISEESVQYFDFVNFDKISSSTGASLTYEDGKYYITISGITTTDEDIEVKVTNKIEDERYYEHTSWNDNLFKIFKSSDEEDPEEAI